MKRGLAALAAVLLMGVASCGFSNSVNSDATTLTVFAAASLKTPFTKIGAAFEDAYPDVTVRFSFAGSSDLVAQLQQGAPADVFAAADTATMAQAADDDLVAGEPTDFASNTLQIATPPDNPADIGSLADLAAAGVQLVVCAPQVPCGAAAADVEKVSGVDLSPVSEEQSVTDVLGKVVSGEADAGLVYVTDVQSAGDRVLGVPFPESSEVVNTYPIAALEDSDHPDAARLFTDFVTGTEGQAILTAAGFGKP